jgi:hypothetical protein
MVTKTFNPRCCCWARDCKSCWQRASQDSKLQNIHTQRKMKTENKPKQKSWRTPSPTSKLQTWKSAASPNSTLFFFPTKRNPELHKNAWSSTNALSLHLNSQTHQLNKAHYVDLEPPKKKKKHTIKTSASQTENAVPTKVQTTTTPTPTTNAL